MECDGADLRHGGKAVAFLHGTFCRSLPIGMTAMG